MPRDPLTRTVHGPARPAKQFQEVIAGTTSWEAATCRIALWSIPFRAASREIPVAADPVATSRSARPFNASPTIRCASASKSPSSNMSPRTAMRRPGCAARTSSAAMHDAGLALYVSSRTMIWGEIAIARIRGASSGCSSDSTIPSQEHPATNPTDAAARAPVRKWRPINGSLTRR